MLPHPVPSSLCVLLHEPFLPGFSVLAPVGKPGQTLAIPLPLAMSSAVIVLSAKPTVMTTWLLHAPGHAYVPGLRFWLAGVRPGAACLRAQIYHPSAAASHEIIRGTGPVPMMWMRYSCCRWLTQSSQGTSEAACSSRSAPSAQ